MSVLPRRYLGPLIVGVALAVAPSAAAAPDIETQSAAAVITELRQEGYTVAVNGVSSSDTSLFTSCKVTQIHNLGDAPDPTTTVLLDVACPISHG